MRGRLCLFAAIVLALAVMPAASAEDATLEDDVEASVVLGLGWLAAQQSPDGSFGSYEFVGHTGLAILKFEDRALDLGLDPLGPEYEYADVVQAGLDYLVGQDLTQAIGTEPAGDPDGDGDGIGVYWQSESWSHQIYTTGIGMMALAASQHPELYGDLLQDAVDYMAWAQADPECGLDRGGWRYTPDGCWSDNSTSGYATLGLGYAQASPPIGFGLTVPQFVKDELSMWIDVMQDDVNGDPDDGGSWYDTWTPWVNILKTGNLLYEMALVGDTVETQRVRDAVDYIERTWSDLDPDVGWMNHRQAMFAMMKGLASQGIELLDLDGDATREFEWFPAVAQHLIDTQNPDGSWPYDYWGDEILSTAWALLTLEKAVPIPPEEVPVDIKPMSCRNPLNVTEKILPVAVLGTEDFDVTQIDPASVRLAGVAPLRWAYVDVATPFEPYIGKIDAFDCTTAGPDGYLDLTFKFAAQAIVAALGEVHNGDVMVIPLTGNLKEEFDGTPIVGEDVIVIMKKAA